MENQTELITQALTEVFYKKVPEGLWFAFKAIFLTPPTCFIFLGMIIFTIVLNALEKKIKKHKNKK